MQISISRFEEGDIENKIRWINNPNVNKYLHYDLPLEYDKTLQWFKNNKKRTDRYDAVIAADGVAVGLIGLLGIDNKNKKAEFYIALGETEYRGKGIAKEATRILLEYAFSELGMNKIYLYTERENVSAQRLFEKVGFQKEGLLKEDLIYNNRKVDRFFYGITKSEYSCKSHGNSTNSI